MCALHVESELLPALHQRHRRVMLGAHHRLHNSFGATDIGRRGNFGRTWCRTFRNRNQIPKLQSFIPIRTGPMIGHVNRITCRLRGPIQT